MDNRKESIFLIEDDQAFRETLIDLLQRENYEVEGVPDGQQAIELTKKRSFDLVVADVRLPCGIDGIETVRRIKEFRPDIKTLVIIITGYADPEAPVRAIQVGVDDYIYKPFKTEDFLHAVKRNLKNYRLEREREKHLEAIKAFNKELTEKNETINAILYSMAEGILTLDKDWRITHFNKVAECITGFKQGEAIGMRCTDVFKADICKKGCLLKASIDAGKPVLDIETNITNKEGKIIPIMVSSSVLKDAKGEIEGGVEVFRDVSRMKEMIEELKRSKEEISQWNEELEQRVEQRTKNLEEAHKQLKDTQVQLLQSAKMAAVGQLGAGVAHELNNPLAGILGFAQFMSEKLRKADFNTEDFKACQRYTESIEKEAERCKKIVENLLKFSRKPAEVKPEALDITQALEETLSIIDYQLKLNNINLIVDIELNLAQVMGITNQLQQVFTNLILNAQDAMPEGGALKIIAQNIIDEKTKTPLKVKIEFTDTGCGIPPENLLHIFEPFFTTKQKEKGIGLGLAISYQIISDHKGTIEVSSQPGEGTAFIITLPVYK